MKDRNVRESQKRTIIVNGYATPEITEAQMAQWAGSLTYVSCYSYGFNMDGSLVPAADSNLIQYAFSSGIAPLMVLTPFDKSGNYSYELVREVFTNPTMRDRLINNLFLLTSEKRYYGVVFNFGPIAAEDNDQFVITVAKTAARLNRRGELVIVSLVPGAVGAGIDYLSLSRAANFIELMAFQWEQSQMPPAGISPFDRMREMLADITKEIDPRTVLLGLPNYGFDGELPFETRLEFVDEFDLAGISIWTIMNPFPAGGEAIDQLFTVFKINLA